MEYLHIYSRRRQKWDKYPLQAGFQEHWVLDKSTDYAKNVVIKFDMAADELTLAADYKVMDWARTFSTA